MELLEAALEQPTRLAAGAALAAVAAPASYVVGVWVLKAIVSVGLAVVPA